MFIYIDYANKERNAAFRFLGHSLPRRGIKMTFFSSSTVKPTYSSLSAVLPASAHLCTSSVLEV